MPKKAQPIAAKKTAPARRPASTRRPAQRTAPAYHHGDLRNALLAATEALLDEAGLEGFTLREVARRAGVSHGAPAHHFGDARGLLSEFTAQSFAQMASAMASHRAAAAPTPFEQLVATGVAYVAYALAHRARFQLMFRSDRLNHDCAPLLEAGHSAYGHLVDCIGLIEQAADSVTSEAQVQRQRQEKTALAWSIVHGFATLMLDNRDFAAHAQGEPARALAMIEAMLTRARPAFMPQR